MTSDCYYYQSGTGACAHGAPTDGGSGSELYSEQPPGLSATTYTYCPGGEADTTTSPAGTTTDAYDAMGDLVSKTYSGTASGYSVPPSVTYTYDLDGSRATMTDGTGTTTDSYDDMGDLTEEAFSAGSGSGLSSNTLYYTYYSTGELATVVYPSNTGYSSPTATYTYDDLGNMASLSDWTGASLTFTHDGDGELCWVSSLRAELADLCLAAASVERRHDGLQLRQCRLHDRHQDDDRDGAHEPARSRRRKPQRRWRRHGRDPDGGHDGHDGR